MSLKDKEGLELDSRSLRDRKPLSLQVSGSYFYLLLSSKLPSKEHYLQIYTADRFKKEIRLPEKIRMPPTKSQPAVVSCPSSGQRPMARANTRSASA